jgi:membrane protease YdiL (CAAX protease family)
MDFFHHEFSAIGHFLAEYKNEIIVFSSAMLFLCLNEYHPISPNWASSLVYYAILPILVIVLVLRKNVLDFGFRLGDVKKWAAYVCVTCLIGAPILYFSSRVAVFQGYYDMMHFSVINYSLTIGITLFASEFLFRGFLIFGLKDRFKEGSILIQMVPFMLVHLGKPEIETLSTILTGIYFGFIVYRTRSYWPAFLIHLFINIFFVVSVNLL